MRKRFGSPRLLLAAVLAAGASPLSAASPISSLRRGGPARVTIRGTGNAIAIERSGEAGPPPSGAEPPSTALARAVAMKESGTTDEALVWYLEAHRSELPAFVDAATVSALRDAGAGRTVIAYLAGVAAVELGPTGAEGPGRDEPAPARPAEAEMTNELPASLAWGGIVVGVPARGLRHHGFGRHGASAPRVAPMVRPGFPAPRFSGRVRPR